jgi:ribosomal protein S8
MPSICDKCKKSTDYPLKCDGVCKKVFHPDCVGVSRSVWKYINDLANLKWFCDACNENHGFMSAMNNKVEDLFMLYDQMSVDQKTTTEQVLSKIENCFDAHKIEKTVPVAKKSKTFADVLKNKEFNPIVVIKSKIVGQESAVTEKIIKQKIDPSVVPVCDMKSTRNGSVILRCQNKEDVNDCKAKIEQELGQNYNVVVPKTKLPVLKIVGLTEMHSENELIEKIVAQNPFLSPTTQIEVAELKQKGPKIFAAVRCDAETYKEMATRGRIMVGWDRCRVYEHIHVMRCYKCAGYNHKAVDCRNETVCAKCAGAHELTKCGSSDEKCINCVNVNKKMNLNLNVAHPVWHRNCPVYVRRLNSEMKKIDFS